MSSSGLAAPVGTLPRPLTTFVGRDSQIDELIDLIQQPHVRLVTVTGPGGVGKTRLAIEVGARTVESFPDGVFFVPLAPISDPGLIVSVIAQSVGAQILPSRTELAELKAHIRERQMLLVIDNFEHVVDAAAVIAELLADCPSLRVLATSRVRLRISGEHQYPLAPLSVAVQGQEGAELPDSVCLFAERARAADPSFAITDENAELVFSICKRLEGLPLAIELAAARITMLSLSGMLARLDHSLPLLSGGARDLPERQRTMRDTIAWSYDLLSDAEQRVFRRLGPLGSGFSFEVIEPVVVLEGEEAGDLLDIVASLVDKSLMYRDIGLAGDTRYVMLQTVREYALEQLEAAGETEALTELQSVKIRDFVIDVQPNLTGQRGLQGFWLRRIDDEFVNIRSAMDHFERAGDVTSLLHLVFSLDWYFTTRAARVNTVRWQELAKADDLGVENWLRIEVLQIMAFLTGIHGNARDSLACAEAALALARLGDDASALGLAYLSMGFAAEFAGQPERALEMGFEAVPRFREAADLRWLPYGLSNLGDLLIYFGRWEEARPLVEEAISLATASGDDFGLAVFTGDLARVRRHEGDLASALRLFRESHALFDQVDGMRGKLGCIAGLASIAFDQGQPEHAARLLGAIDAQMQRAGVKVIAFNLMTRRIKDEVRERLGEEAYEREFEAGRSIPWSDAVADAMALAVDTTGDSEDESPVNPFGLTSRERDVLRQLIEGRSDKEIADALYIGARTVQTHVANLLAKLDVHNRAEAAAVAVRNNLL